MENIKRPGFVTSIVTVAWMTVSAVVLTTLLAAVISFIFALVAGATYNLFVAPVLGWAYAPVTFVWALFFLGWMISQWFRAYATKKES